MATLHHFSNLPHYFCTPPNSPHLGHTTATTRVQRLLPSPLNQAGRTCTRAPEAVTEKAAAAAAAAVVTSEPDQVATPEELPSVDFAFVSSRLLPDGSPDIQTRSACGGQKLRDIMLDGHIDLYGPYARPLLNCGGGGTCGTCLVEVIEGNELLSLLTDKEKEALKKVVIQQLPEWKAHDWQK